MTDDNTQISKDFFYPATSAQMRIWLLRELNPEVSAYNVVLPLRLQGTVDFDRLRNVIERLFASQPILNTVYNHDGNTLIVSHRKLEPELFATLSKPLPVLDTEVRHKIEDSSKIEFDLENGPLFKIDLLQVNDSEHILLLVFHHLVCDGISLAVIADQLYREYSGEEREPASEYTYSDYASYEAEYLESAEYDEDLKYWKDKVNGISASYLPSSGRREPEHSEGEHNIYWLNPGLSAKVRMLASSKNMTLFQLLASIFAIALYRFTGQEDVAFGCIVNGRVDQRFTRTIGLFGNTVVLRRRIRETETFTDHLRGWRNDIVATMEHSRVPFERVVEVAAPSREKGMNPLFNIMLDFQGSERAVWKLDGASVNSIDFESNVAQFDFKCMLIDDGDRISIGLEHRTDLYSRSDMDSFAEEFERLCRAAVSRPSDTVGQIVSASADQLWKYTIRIGSTQNLLSGFEAFPASDGLNSTQVFANQDPSWESMHPLLRVQRQVEFRPKEIAVTDDSGSMTYEDLWSASMRLATRLSREGVEVGGAVAVCLSRSSDSMVAVLACWALGAAYSPLDEDQPVKRLDRIMDILEPQAVITETNIPIDSGSAACIYLDWDRDELLTESEFSFSDQSVSIDSPAYVIFTSGTTGTPKGVPISHRALVNYLNWCTNAYHIDETYRRVPVTTSWAFDMAVTMTVYPLTVGGQVDILSKGPRLSALVDYLSSQTNIGLLKVTPTQLEIIAHHIPMFESLSVKTLVLGGEALTMDSGSVNNWILMTPECVIYNEYGPTECTVGCVVYSVTETDEDVVPIGRPFEGVTTAVVDKLMRPVPPGGIGELLVGGVQLFRGYLGDDETQAQCFVQIPEPTGMRFYRTGDLVRLPLRNEMEYLGRADSQLKIRGYRVEPAEIEAAILDQERVEAAAIISRKREGGDVELIAAVVADDEAEILADLHGSLPDYMVPTAIIRVVEMPMTANGKLDTQRILELSELATTDPIEVQNPQTDTEVQLLELWKETLGAVQISTIDNFFDVGGESLSAARLVIKIRKEFNSSIPLVSIFDYPTIKSFAKQLDQEREMRNYEFIEGNGTSIRDRGDQLIEQLITEYNAKGLIILRGFHIDPQTDLVWLAEALGVPLQHYLERSTPRDQIGDRIYTSTKYPPQYPLLYHNENSYQDQWPEALIFYCNVPAASGGSTWLSPVAEVLNHIPVDLLERMQKIGYQVVRNFHPSMGLSWQETFQTTDRDEVSRYCDTHSLDHMWKDDVLQTVAHRPVVENHWRTGEPLWFNHAALFNINTIDSDTREALTEIYPEEDLPLNTYMGDGTRITESEIASIWDAYESYRIVHQWEAGDLVIFDNMRFAHAREPFSGDRQILTCLAGSIKRQRDENRST